MSDKSLDALKAWDFSPEQIKALKQQRQTNIKEIALSPWPENKRAWRLFQQCDTQWNISMAGAIGLNGSFVLDWIKLHESKPRRIKRFYKDIDCIVKGALNAMREHKK